MAYRNYGRTGVSAFLVFAFVLSASACSTWTRKARGAAIGAGAGGVVGGVIGNRLGSTAKGAILGAAIGGTAGALIGDYMDRQAAEMRRDLEGARIERVGEGIKVTFPSGILFDYNSAAVRADADENIAKFARILKKYDDTEILIEGHADATGTEEYNQRLSERRAASVEGELRGLGVSGRRVDTEGYGETQPVVDNSTDWGRQQNRRVEVAIYANDELKRAAERGELR